jgi:outer membrane protein OmpA-like peptidoglycan-associated protein
MRRRTGQLAGLVLATSAVLAALLGGCGGPPQPPALAEAERVARAPSGRTAATLAPEAFAHAEKLRLDARAAFQNDDRIAAQTLAERAIAAYHHALVLSRSVLATETANRARLALEQAEQAFSQYEAEHKRIATHADDLEVRANVIKDAVPIAPVGPTDATREAARLSSARSLALDARLLCAGAKMLAPTARGLVEAQTALSDLDKRLQQLRPAPIDAAMRCRAQCLSVLTTARRTASTMSTLGRADQLLADLSAMGGLAPARDDRGVAVTLRGLFAGGQITTEGKERLEALGRVAKTHPEFPLVVVVHASGSGRVGREDLAADRQRGMAVSQTLVRGGAAEEKIFVEPAGISHPLLDPALARDPRRNERVEIVFVDPGG